MLKMLNGLPPQYLSVMFTYSSSFHDYAHRSSEKNLELPKNRTQYYISSFAFTGAKFWNELPSSLKDETSLKSFVCKLDGYTIRYQ